MIDKVQKVCVFKSNQPKQKEKNIYFVKLQVFWVDGDEGAVNGLGLLIPLQLQQDLALALRGRLLRE
jgi:hypothetical protein